MLVGRTRAKALGTSDHYKNSSPKHLLNTRQAFSFLLAAKTCLTGVRPR
ncbi:hypothetical protein BN2497_6515 [Janthinobacterium sp. CG23_2]|nr:hypothetical protein BN2497_6515 [Janthinobacterium sp. CG23_2]CUU29655.1 hypothetical protein BN3177_6515 [Janthinobacterium sp. CG23_2]